MKIQYQDHQLIVFESELMRTTCTLLIGEQHLLLTDPNWLPSEVEFIAQKVAELRQERPLYLFFTHSDYDHIIAYERFRATAKVIVSEAFLRNPDWQYQLRDIEKFYDQYYLIPPWPVVYPQVADLVIRQLAEPHVLAGETYHFYQAPGHNGDGLLAFHEASGTLIVGDYLCDVEFPFIYYSVAAYEATLDRLATLLAELPVQTLVAGHGDLTQDPSAMQQRLQDARWYVGELRASATEKRPFNEALLWQRYPHFKTIQGQYHRANLDLMQRELNE